MRHLTTALVLTTALGLPTLSVAAPPRHGAHPSQGASQGRPATTGRLEVRLREGARREGPLPVDPGSVLAGLLDDGALTRLRPLVHVDRASLQTLKRQGEGRTGRPQADLSLWLLADVADGARERVLAALAADPTVDHVGDQDAPIGPPTVATVAQGFAPRAVGPTTPDLTSHQGYAGPPEGYGIDARRQYATAGGRGENVAVADVEYSWDSTHEDLGAARRRDAVLAHGTPVDPFTDTSHGTAVLGELVADENTGGVTGIVPLATPYLVNAYNAENGYDVAGAIALAAVRLEAGDVVLVEQQRTGCGGDYGPVETDVAAYEAIKAAVAKGVHVVEAAGNGNQDLDSPCYKGDAFPEGRGDSGAVVVGAAAPGDASTPAGTRLWFSSHGSRVDLHGWGGSVTTTSYGDAFDAGPSRRYTDSFAGTSSASPIVAGAIALVSSVAQAQGRTISPETMRSTLVATGQEKVAGQQIGRLPDVTKALTSLGLGSATTSPALVNGDFEKGALGWRGATGAITSLGYPASGGSLKAALGGHGRTVSEYLETTLTVPAGTASLAYDYRVVTRETGTTARDRLLVQLLDASGRVVSTLATHTNAEASASYSTRGVSLAAYAGKTLRLRFTSNEDAVNATTFLVDSVRLSS